MAFKPPPAILQRVMKFKAIKHKEGKFLLWDIPCFISELYTFIYLQRLLEKELGVKKTADILYSMGYLQAEKGIKMVTDRFGYAKTISDKKKLMEFNLGQSEMVGMGQFEIIRLDFEDEILIIKGNPPAAHEYKRFFGTQKNPVDYFVRGSLGATGKLSFNKRCLCVETMCTAMGKQYCEFMVKPIDKWDKNDPIYKSQSIDRIRSMKDLGAKIEPYIISKG